MRNRLLISLVAVVTGLFAFTFSTHAENQVSNQTVLTCGKYRYDVNRYVDGFLINVTDDSRTRTMFYRDPFASRSAYGEEISSVMYTQPYSSVIRECSDDALPIANRSIGKYGYGNKINLIDPTQNALRSKELGTQWSSKFTEIIETTPADAAAQMDLLLSKPKDVWAVTRTNLVRKQPIPAEKSDGLNDKSYYMFDAKGNVVRKTATSAWNTTLATDSVECTNGVTYVLYAKHFAEANTASSTSPAIQYMIERSGDGKRMLIPVPYADGSWRVPGYDPMPYFGRCFGKSAGIYARGRVSIVSDKTPFVSYLNPKTSIAADYSNSELYFDGSAYYDEGIIWLNEIGIQGDASLLTLNANGTVTKRKPVFFRDLRQYPVGSGMKFRKDPKDPKKIVVLLSIYNNNPDLTVVKYFLESSGTYTEVSRSEQEWVPREYNWDETGTPLYVSADTDMLTVRSFFLEKPMLLHGFLPGTAYTLLWHRVGPLEQDGTRKIRYAFTSNGRIQTWLAVVR